MADSKISALTEKKRWDFGDEFPMVDHSGAPATKRIVAERVMARTTAPGGRLTLSSTLPVTTSDVTGATDIYYLPFVHDLCPVVDDGEWRLVEIPSAGVQISIGTLADATKPRDIWGFANGDELDAELLAWTNATTRATDWEWLNGRRVKVGDHTRILLGTMFPASTTTCEDSYLKRYLSNLYNAVPRFMVNGPATSYSGNTSWRVFNNDSNINVQYVSCIAERLVRVNVHAAAWISGGFGGAYAAGVGVDSTTTPATLQLGGGLRADDNGLTVWKGFPGIGKHTLYPLESSNGGGGTTEWVGGLGVTVTMTNGQPQTGIAVEIDG